MFKEITVKEALALKGSKLIDVRSEREFAEATIPGSVNIPVLRDAERAAVGTLYKNQGLEDARNLGLEYVSPRLPEMIRQYRRLESEGPLIAFCWRGGMRSKSVCSLLDSVGIPVYRLVGGYKAYRRYVNSYLAKSLPHKAVVLHGLTGVGKTEVLQVLRQLMAPAIDLEGIANNRGSVFGQIGMGNQPSQKMFDGLLVKELALWEPAGHIFVECESRRIGRIILPTTLVEAMKKGLRILTYCSVNKRIERIIRMYGSSISENGEKLREAITSLTQRLGRKKAEELCRLLDNGQLEEVVEYLLINYYDPLYKYPSEPSNDYDLSVDTGNVQNAAAQIVEFVEIKVCTPVEYSYL